MTLLGGLVWSKIYGLPRNPSQFNENTLNLVVDLNNNIFTLSEETFQQNSAISLSKLDNCGNTFCRFTEVLLANKTHTPASSSSSLTFNLGSTPALTQSHSDLTDITLSDTSLCFVLDQSNDNQNEDTCIWKLDIEALADCINSPARFYDKTQIVLGQIFQRKWKWGDGNEALGGNEISYQYTEPGTYMVGLEIVGLNSDNKVCIGIDSVEVVIPNTLYIEYNKSHRICIGDSVTLDYNRLSCWKLPLRATWSPNIGFFNINDLEPTLATTESRWYYVELTDGNGLTQRDSVWVEVDSSCCRSRARFSTDKDIYCLSDSIEITNLSSALFNAQYMWDLDNPNMSSYNGPFPPKLVFNNPGKYKFQLTLSDACSSDTFSKYIFIFENPELDFRTDSVLCEPGHTFQIGGAPIANNDYFWLNPEMTDNRISSPTVTVNTDTQFIVRMQDYLTACFAFDTISFKVVSLPKFFLGNDTTLCSNQSITIGTEFASDSSIWSNGSKLKQIEVQAPGGDFTNDLFFSGCIASDTISIKFSDLNELEFSLPNDTHFCSYEPYTIIPTGELVNPIWNTGSRDTSILDTQGGLYILSSNNDYCTYSDSISILRFFIEEPILSADKHICNLDTLTLSPITDIGRFKLEWDNGDTAFQRIIDAEGEFWIKLYNDFCVYFDTIKINNYKIESGFLGNDTAFCNYEIINIAPDLLSNNYRFLWDDGSTQRERQFSVKGTYWLKVYNDYCEETDTIQIIQNQIPKPFLLNDTLLCIGDSLILSPLIEESNHRYIWDNSDTTKSRKIFNEGVFWLTIYDEYCSETDSVVVVSKKLPRVNAPSDTTLCIGDTLFLSIPISELNSYHWNPGLSNNENWINEPGEYQLYTENICGDSTYYIVLNTKNCKCNPYIPNSFSPNNDGINEKFLPFYCENDFIKLEVFDRWGNKLFQTQSEEVGWDGIYNGKPVPTGTYMWIITTSLDGKAKVLSGTVQVLR